MAVKTETPNDTKSTDRIEKRVVFRAPRTRVWRALTNAEEFGTWFRVKLESPFTEGKPVRGRLSIPGYEHVMLEMLVEMIVWGARHYETAAPPATVREMTQHRERFLADILPRHPPTRHEPPRVTRRRPP